MTTNKPNHSVDVKIGEQGTGMAMVPHQFGQIEMVKVKEFHGVPHVRPAGDLDKSWIEVLGAIPDSVVTVVYYA